MTDQTGKAPPVLREKFPVIAASVIATLTVAACASFLGRAGAVVGLAATSALSGVCNVLYERWLRRGGEAARRARERTRARKQAGMPALASDTMIIQAVRDDRSWFSLRKLPLLPVVLTAGVVAAVSLAGFAAVEAAANKPVTGFTLRSSEPRRTVPAPAVTVTPTVTVPAVTVSPTVTETPTVTPTVTVTPTPVTTPTVTPTVTPSTTVTPTLAPASPPSTNPGPSAAPASS